MNGFKLKSHRVKAASFIENREKETKIKIEVGVEGGILIPKDYTDSSYVVVHLKFHFGAPEERVYFTLETLSEFEIEMENTDFPVDEESVQNTCVPIALAELRKTVKRVTEAYGMPAVDLPPFEEESKK